MEFKTPIKKGFKTPRDRPPLPMLNESFSGWCVDEYDWPLFTGYYNGTSVIVDDPQAMNLLTNKGFFGKGSISRGCPNLPKRKIPSNVVYESQWKRRKMWIQSLSALLKSEKESSQTVDNEASIDVKITEVENEKNNSCSADENTSKMNTNESNKTKKDNMADIEEKKIDSENKNPRKNNSCEAEEEAPKAGEEIKENNKNFCDNIVNIDDEKSNNVEIMKVDNEKNISPEKSSCIITENPSRTNGNEEKEESKNVTSCNVIDIDDEKSNDIEILKADNEKNRSPQKYSCKTNEESSRTNVNENKGENKNETYRDNIASIDDEKSNDVEIMVVDNDKNISLQNNSGRTDESSRINGKEDSKESKNETSQVNIVNIDDEKSNDVEVMLIDNEKYISPQKNSCKTKEHPSRTNGNNGSKIETSQDNIINIDDEKTNDVEIMEVDNEKSSSLKTYSHITEGNLSSKTGSEEGKNESSQDNIDDEKSNDVEIMIVDNEKNNLCLTKEKPSRTNGNEGDDLNKNDSNETSEENKTETDNKNIIHSYKLVEVPFKTSESEDVDMKQITQESEVQKEIRESKKNEEIKNITQNEKSKDDKLIDETIDSSTSKVIRCVGKINLTNNMEKEILNVNEVLVIPDIEGESEGYILNLKPRIEEEKVKTAVEVLYLSLEDAFFLSYSCNCLQVFDLTSNILQYEDMWTLFQESQPDFIEKYVAYHYFRAKGWVVKSGTKFGGDFLLYKKGPLYFHSSYIVIVEVLKNDKNTRNKITWQKIIGMNRMAESATKEILICHVLWPDVEEKELKNPGVLKEFRVSETLLRRWQATQEKNPEFKKQ